jgi:hypothetical protein
MLGAASRQNGGTARVLAALGAIAVLVATWVLALPSWHGWFDDDDFTNLRWVEEYRDDPLAALWGLHAMHDHVRPFNLIFHWIGAELSNGDWWGPHAVLVALHLGCVAATMALAGRRYGPQAAWVAGVLTLGLGGAARILTWNAWIGSAGEVALGISAVAAADAALASGAAWLAGVALVLGVGSGLFKEPGWFVYPAAIAGMALPAWITRRARPRIAILLLGALLLGAAGFALTWHPANAARLLTAARPVGTRVLIAVRQYGLNMVSLRPLSDTSCGVPAILVALGIWRDLTPRRLGRVRPALVAVAAVVTVAAWAREPDQLGFSLVILLSAVVVRHFRAPPPELLFGLATIGMMAQSPGPDPVHGIAAAYAVAIWTAGHLVALAGELFEAAGRSRLGRSRALLAAGILAMAVLPAIEGVHAFANPATPREAEGRRSRISALSGLARLVHAAGGVAGPDAHAVAAIIGIPERALFSAPDFVTLDVPTLAELVAPRSAVVDGLLGGSLLPAGPQAASVRELDVDPGAYAIGIVGAGLENAGVAMSVRDACKHEWTAPAPSGDWAELSLLQIAAGCGKLTVRVGGADVARAEAFLLTPLPRARFDLRGMAAAEHSLDVHQRVVPTGRR